MIVTVVKCEMCDRQHAILPMQRPNENVPVEWITLFRGNLQDQEGWHFCSQQCLARWATGVTTEVEQKPVEIPQSKMQRFRLFTDNGDEKQGVLCENGHILIDEHDQNKETHYHSWDECKTAYPGGGVQWIDQEVSDASNGN